VESARERLAAAEQQARADAAAELVKLDQSQRRVKLAESMASIAERNVDAQRKRYLQGDAIALEVRQAEDELRRARLSVEQARTDAVVASIRIDHVTGLLLVRYASIVPREPPQTRASATDVP
jgi:outer membrane protein TolC